eukprot:6177636-Pleurochrysis_carterae.AAC.2
MAAELIVQQQTLRRADKSDAQGAPRTSVGSSACARACTVRYDASSGSRGLPPLMPPDRAWPSPLRWSQPPCMCRTRATSALRIFDHFNSTYLYIAHLQLTSAN